MFLLYLKEAEQIDRLMATNWKGTTDGILIFMHDFPPSVLIVISFLYRLVFPLQLLQHFSLRVTRVYQKQLIQ
jgi:hypothetical protein